MMVHKRIVVSGMGAVSPLGNTLEETWSNLLAKKSGIAKIASFDASPFPTQIAAEVRDFSLKGSYSPKWLKRTVPTSRFALAAAEEAFQDAGIKPKASNAARFGLVIGSGMMTTEYAYWEKFTKAYAPHGEIDLNKVGKDSEKIFSASDFAKTQGNIGLSLLAEHYNIRGYANTVHTACASGGQALGLALQVLRRGDADCILAGGYDSMINPFGLSSFCLLGALSKMNDSPEQASRPFDYLRQGFVLGEGAAFLVLETEEHAKARGARIYAEFAGEGNSLSAYRITDSHPSGDGAIQAIQRALAEAGLKPEDIDYINAHGTSTKMNDLSETNAIKSVFANCLDTLPLSSTKSQTGHLIAAAGALEGVLSVKALESSWMPMTMNRDNPDPECDLDYIVEGPRQKSIRAVMSNSFGFGGSNSCLVFKQWD